MVLPRQRVLRLGSRPRLLVDVDEVLADFQTPALDLMGHVLGKRYVPEDFTVWDIFTALNDEQKNVVFAAIERPGWCASLKPLPGAVEAIQEIQTFADVFPVTSPFHSTPWMTERTKWLSDHFGWAKGDVVFTSAKYLVVGDALLDDKPDNVVKWAHYHPYGAPMLWHIPNTRMLTDYDKYRVTSWQQVIDQLKNLATP